MEQKCKVCNKTLTIDDYRRFDLCKDCYSKGMKLLEDEEKNNPSYNYGNTTTTKLGSTGTAILVAIIVIIIAIISSSSGGSGNRYKSLTKEQKSYLQQSYGNGKSQAIDKAIKDYKSSH